MLALKVKPKNNAIFTSEGYPRRNPALPLANVVTTACESVPPIKRTPPPHMPSWWLKPGGTFFESECAKRTRAVFSTFN